MSKFLRQPKSAGFRKARIDWFEFASFAAICLFALLAGVAFFLKLSNGEMH